MSTLAPFLYLTGVLTAALGVLHFFFPILFDFNRAIPRHSAPPSDLRARYRPTGDMFTAERGSFEYFLTARYCLYTTEANGQVSRGEIHHAPWRLQPAKSD